MNWYIAKIVFRIICGEGNHTSQFDEQWRLISATGKSEALNKAREMGRKEEDSFLNHSLERVTWVFVDVPELSELKEIKDGMEVFSRIEEKENAEHYMELIRQKAAEIENASSRLTTTR